MAAKGGQEFAEALEVAARFVEDFDRRVELTEEILRLYRLGWANGADHILAELGKAALKRSTTP